MPYQGPPLTREPGLVAIEIARLTGMPIEAIESYADGEVTDPAVAHFAVRAPYGIYLDGHGARDFSGVVSKLYGATFGMRRVTAEQVREAVEALPHAPLSRPVSQSAFAALEAYEASDLAKVPGDEVPTPAP
jgi:hypothetical protein